MMEFFRPWRRKIGCLTLLIACVAMAGWIGSLTKQYTYGIRYSATAHDLFQSHDGSLFLHAYRISASIPPKDSVFLNSGKWHPSYLPVGWRYYECPPHSMFTNPDFPTLWRYGFGGFEIGKCEYPFPVKNLDIYVVVIPYWPIVIPLTALSAFLLLSKPSISTQKKIAEPIPEERV